MKEERESIEACEGVRQKMKLEQLHQIITIEKYKSISKAAKALYMRQPALSSSLNNFEKKIGVQIFVRTPQGVTPTEDGKKILELAYGVMNNCNAIMNYSSQNEPEQMTGTIKISLAPMYSYLFFDIMSRYKAKFPKADLQLGIYPIARMREMVHRGECTMAMELIPPQTINQTRQTFVKLKEHRVCLFAGPFSKFYDRESVDIKELREEEFVAFSKEYWEVNNKNLKIKNTPTFIEDNASIRKILSRSSMIGIMPDTFDKVDMENYEGRPRKIPIEGLENPTFHGYMVYPKDRQLTLLEQYSIAFVKELMEELE